MKIPSRHSIKWWR